MADAGPRFVVVLTALLCAANAARADEQAAKDAEASAFAAIDEERWCDAVHAFLLANEAAPSIDLIYNAALAADEALDRKRALKLYVELLGAYPNSDRGTAVQARITELTQLVRSDGEGSRCADPVGRSPDEDPAGAVSSTPSPSEPPAPPASLPIVPWAVAGAGAGLLLIGVGVAVVGVLPYADFVDAREQIIAAEKQGGDAAALQERQDAARGAWTTWGELSLWAGVATSILGGAVAAGGVGWALVAGGEE